MSCPLNKNRWAGSGYEKPTTVSASSKELDTKMKQMLAEREKQDANLFPTQIAIEAPQKKESSLNKNR